MGVQFAAKYGIYGWATRPVIIGSEVLIARNNMFDDVPRGIKKIQAWCSIRSDFHDDTFFAIGVHK